MRFRTFLILAAVFLMTAIPINVFAGPSIGGKQLVPWADLVIDSILVSNPVQEGDKVGTQSIFAITVKNIGKGTSSEAYVKITLTALNGGPAPADMSGIWRCRVLQPGESVSFAWPNMSNDTWKAGKYRLTIEADSGNAVSEDDEANNSKSLDFNVLSVQQLRPKTNLGIPAR